MTRTSIPVWSTRSRTDIPVGNPRVWGALLGGFTLLAALGLALPLGSLGVRVLVLVVLFHIGVVLVSRATADVLMWRAWVVLAPLSVVMVLPDWFLSAELGTLVFPNTGSPFIGTVPIFMAGMWTIALMPIVWVAATVARKVGIEKASAVAALAGLVLFWAAELAAPLIPLWEPVGVTMFAGVAAYVLLPEMVLSAAAFLLVMWRMPRWLTVGLVVLLPFTYTGMLATSYQFLG